MNEAVAVWIAGGAVSLVGALIYGELAARIPETGGEYAFLRAAFGPFAAFLFGWTTLFVAGSGGLAAVAIVMAKNVALLTGGRIADTWTVIGVLAALAGLNCLGVRTGDRTQAALCALKVGVILIIVAIGFHLAPATTRPMAVARSADHWRNIGAAMIPVLFTYGGWQTANYVAGEMKRPARDLGVALALGVVIVIVLYLLVDLACLRGLGPSALASDLTPVADLLGRATGPAGARAAAAVVALSAFAFLAQGMLTGPRVVYAMARDGRLPRLAAGLSTRRAPTAAIVILAVWTGVLALSGRYEQLLSFVTAMNFLFYGLCAAALFVLRRRRPQSLGFRTPFQPLLTALFIAVCIGVILAAFVAFPIESAIGYGIMIAGAPLYILTKRRTKKVME
jgi:APA family basic amino acid/polyamine antiporter